MVCATNAALLETPTKSAPQRQDNTTALCIFITQTPQPSIQVPRAVGCSQIYFEVLGATLSRTNFCFSCQVVFVLSAIYEALWSLLLDDCKPGRVAFAKDQRKSPGNVGREPGSPLGKLLAQGIVTDHTVESFRQGRRTIRAKVFRRPTRAKV